MKKIAILIFLYSLHTFSQGEFCPQCYYEEKHEIKNKSSLINVEITKYKPQLDFQKLDSIDKQKFIENVTLMTFDDNNLIKYEATDFLNGLKLDHDSYSFNYEDDKLKKIEYVDLMPYSYKSRREVFQYENEIINHFIYNYNIDIYNKKSISKKYEELTEYTLKDEKITRKRIISKYNSVREEVYKYNNRGDIIYEKIPGIIIENKYTYNNKGEIIKEITTNSSNRKFITSYIYKNNNLIQEKTLNVSSNILDKKTYDYDKNQLIKKSDKYQQTIYKYDENGNWIEKKIIQNGVLFRLFVCKLKYKE